MHLPGGQDAWGGGWEGGCVSDGINEGFDGIEKVVDPVRGGRIAAKATALVLICSALCGLVWTALRVGGTAVEGVAAQGEHGASDHDRIARKAAEIRALGREVEAAKQAFERKKAEAESRFFSRQDDRTELDRLNAAILSLEAKRAEAIKEWDVMSAAAGTAAVWSER